MAGGESGLPFSATLAGKTGIYSLRNFALPQSCKSVFLQTAEGPELWNQYKILYAILKHDIKRRVWRLISHHGTEGGRHATLGPPNVDKLEASAMLRTD